MVMHVYCSLVSNTTLHSTPSDLDLVDVFKLKSFMINLVSTLPESLISPKDKKGGRI